MCAEHKHKEVELLCSVDGALVCVLCIATSHIGHKCEELQPAAEARCKALLAQAELRLKALRVEAEGIEKRLQESKLGAAAAAQQIDEECDRVGATESSNGAEYQNRTLTHRTDSSRIHLV